MIYVLVLLIGVPILEIYVFILVGSSIGGLRTVAIVVITAVLGAYLLRREGISVLQKLRGKLEQGDFPAGELAEALLVLIAGVLLLTPGFVTDGVGFLMILPFSRRWLGVAIVNWFVSKVGIQVAQYFRDDSRYPHTKDSEQDKHIIDVDYEDKIPPPSDKGEKNAQ